MTRTYQSALRAEQMEQTREKILEAVLELTNENAADVTVATAADRAGISVRTAYRYFPTLDSLLDEFNGWIAKRLGGAMRLPDDVTSLPRFIEELYEFYERNEAFFRATRAPSAGKGVSNALRARRKVDQLKAIEKLIAPITKGRDERSGKKLGAIIHSLIGLDTFWNLTEVWGLTRQEAVSATIDAVDQVIGTHMKKGEPR